MTAAPGLSLPSLVGVALAGALAGARSALAATDAPLWPLGEAEDQGAGRCGR